MSENQEWNPRFVLYAEKHGRTPEGQLEHDRIAYPGGCMTGFTLWTRQCVALYAEKHPENVIDGHVVRQSFYDTWLQAVMA